MTDNLDLPVVIYISKQGCPACIAFEREWSEIKRQLSGKARTVKFVCDASHEPPPCIRKYSGWFPSLICAGPRSYYRIYTPNDQVNQKDYSPNYELKAKKFNAVEDYDRNTHQVKFSFGGRANSAANFMAWFNRLNVKDFDESTPPTSYANYFQQ